MTRSKNLKRVAIAASVAISAGLLAGCGGDKTAEKQSGAATPSGDHPILTVYAGTQTPVVANFNPYSPTALPGAARGVLYEPLFYYNKSGATDPVPMLAQSVEWSEDGMELTIHMRPGVKWNDGKPLTAEDIRYSFTNEAASSDFIENIDIVDPETLKMTFNAPSFQNEYSILGATYIVPEHVFGELDDLTTFANADNPVGTGPFMVESVTDAAFTVVKNPNYWEAGRPGIDRVQFLGIDSNNSAESMLRSGDLDYTTIFVPDPDAVIAPQDLGYINYVGSNNVPLLVCVNADLGCTGIQTDKAVRQALSAAIDRSEIIEKAYYGTAGPASPVLMMPGRDDKWLAPGISSQNAPSADPEQAKQILEAAGYTLGDDGIYAKDGERVSMVLESVEGWSDANAGAELMVAQAKAAGIELVTQTVTFDLYTERRGVGEYQLFLGSLTGTPTPNPFLLYRNNLTTDFTQPVGTPLIPGQTNFARYSNSVVDDAIKRAAVTTDEDVMREAYEAIQEQIIEDMPYISILQPSGQTFFNQTDFTGWPSLDNLYATPASYGDVSAAYILSRLDYK